MTCYTGQVFLLGWKRGRSKDWSAMCGRAHLRTGVSVQVVTVLTGDLSPNASLVVVATPAVGNRDQTRSCPCECLFDLFSIKRQKDTRLIGIWSLIGGNLSHRTVLSQNKCNMNV